MIITQEWLEEKGACKSGKMWVIENASNLEGVDLVKKLMESGKLDWANLIIVRLMERPQYLAYAIYAAEQVVDIYEKKYTNDWRPRNAINAAK